jgi:GNAT superfamily N-acetyltransferase
VTVRLATLADREALCLLYHQFRDFHVRGVPDRLTSLGDPPPTFEGSEFSRMLAGILASEDAALFVAVRGGRRRRVRQSVHPRRRPEPGSYRTPLRHLQSLMAGPAARRQGAGRALAAAAEAWARERGAVEMRFDTWEFPDAPGAFYERVGYGTVRRSWFKPLR